MSDRQAVIKKYENRRLYDTGSSRYVNLDDVARMVREGVDVQVIDARTGGDLTRVILTQIIMEDAKGHESGLPLDLLRKLIVASDRATHDFLSWYLTTVTDMYQKAQSALQTRPLDLMRNIFSSLPHPAAPPPPVPGEELEALRRHVQELEARLEQVAAVRKKPRKKRT
ncbi:MAG TPA: polyhydroxyalkanoate synthesis regulator DNA-binding domain-containing protein [Bryobacteraceae bacterium]|nr:polyhydroxyalkanoate synthesis regulator DNA-binding domain-containing protein [Bryobacteraceae bacterium]